jgi:hypothetical protein
MEQSPLKPGAAGMPQSYDMMHMISPTTLLSIIDPIHAYS